MSRNDPVSRLGCSNYVRLIDPIFRGAEESPAHRQLFRRLIIGDFHPCRLEPGSSDTHRINVCARFGIRKTLKFKAFVPRTHRNASNMPASPFYSKTRALEPVDESRGARIGGGAAVAPCGARGGPGAAQARLPSHAVALHSPPVPRHPCVRPNRRFLEVKID